MSNRESTAKKRPHEEFAEQVVEMLQNGTAPWQQSWKAGEFHAPFNPVTGTVYNGINRVNLSKHDYADPRWMTFRQANEEGLRVQAGSHATPIVFWQWTEKVDRLDEEGRVVLDADGKPEKVEVELDRPRVHYYAVFNATQLRLENGENLAPYEPQPLEWNPHEKAEAILQNSGAVIHHDQRERAFYRPSEDAIHLPPRANFDQAGDYYSTALHELGHWACAKSRLNVEGGVFGSEAYAKEELRAEIASWMLCQDLGLDFKPENSAAYVANWMQAIKEDPYEIVRACRDAERIKKYVLGLELGQTQTVSADAALESEAARATPERGGNLATVKVFLEVPYREKEAAKELGATWDRDAKKWCARPGADLDKLAKWLPQAEAARAIPAQADEYQPEVSRDKVFLAVPFREKEQAKAQGAKWDREAKLWFAPAGADLTPLAKWIPEKEPTPAPNLDPTDEFAQRLVEAGFKLDGPPAMDGRIQRVPVEGGKAGAKDGAYSAHLDGRPNGWFHNHRTGEQVKWVATGQVLTDKEKETLKAQAAANLAERERERNRKQFRAQQLAHVKWMAANDELGTHAYLKAKGVEAFGVKNEDCRDLLVPGFSLETGELMTLQHITADGRKRFEANCPKAGAVCLIAPQDEINRNPAGEILLAEGYATGASLHMATGKPVAVAFDAGNLKTVAIQLREKFPEAVITICADNDHKNKKNVGLEKALDAAQAVQGKVVIPDFTEEEKKRGLTDFNDLHQARGLKAVAAAVDRALERPAEPAKSQGVGR